MKNFYNTLTELEKKVYECGYRKCKEEVLRVLQHRKPYFDIYFELDEKLESKIQNIKENKKWMNLKKQSLSKTISTNQKKKLHFYIT